ncbi:MAG: ATP-binding protein [Alphaproteobacteria bacterium]
MTIAARTTKSPLGFQPGLSVADPVASHWLSQATFRLRREIAWLWHQRGTSGGSAPAGALPPPIDTLSDALDLARCDSDRQAFFAGDTTAAWLGDRIALPEPATARARPGSFAGVAEKLRLRPVDRLALALALGDVLDSARGPVIAACLNDPGATQPTLALLQRLWDAPHEVLDLLDTAHPLSATGLLDPAPVHWHSPLQVAPMVARQLLFPEAALPGVLKPVAAPAGNDNDKTLELPVARLKTRAADRASLVPVIGPPGAPRAATAARIARGIGLPLLQVSSGAAEGAALGPLLVMTWLRGAALFLPFAAIAGKDGPPAHLFRLPLVIFVGMEETDAVSHLPPQVTLARVRLEPIAYAERLARWRRELPEIWSGPTGRQALTECARRFRQEGETIAHIAAALRALPHPPAPRDLYTACRADLDLGDLAQPVDPRFDLEELMLPPQQAGQIGQLVTAAGALTRVHHDWGMARAWNESGLSVLFSGPPGTGKTMAAEAISRALEMPIYRIDLSQVVNKYIGETEKNLRRLFDAADAADVILFFDEADSLFGKRTEVKDAHDRYANLEVSYLLERMERFKGMAILASNRKKDLDEAFKRRLRYIVHFPLPGPEERLRIWRAVLPKGADCSGLDLDFLAERIPLAGGHIRSIVFNACLQSVRDDAAPLLVMSAVVRAVKDEFDKLGRAVSLDQFGRYAEYLRE